MLKSVEGVYRDGKVELIEPAPEGADGKVIVTFLSADGVDIASRGIGEIQAAEQRSKLSAFAEDWQSPEMEAYDAL